jgi:hypothetical protein
LSRIAESKIFFGLDVVRRLRRRQFRPADGAPLNPARETFRGRGGEVTGTALEFGEELWRRPIAKIANNADLADLGPQNGL